LILVLHCKHGESRYCLPGVNRTYIVSLSGVLKKHSLNLSPCECLIAEVDPNASPNNFTVPARTLKDWIEHFAVSSGTATITTSSGGGSSGGSSIKYENELGWYFAQNEIKVKTLEANRPPAMRQYLSTEIKIAPDEFDEYHVEEGPVQLAFPLREFRVSDVFCVTCYLVGLTCVIRDVHLPGFFPPS
jgi:cell cycle checkpoint control protein RAD9A